MRGDGGRDRRDMVGRGAAAAADDVDEAGACELADQAGHEFRALVILAEFVGQAGVRIGTHQRIRDAANVSNVGAQVLGAERAVEADGGGPGVFYRIPERFRQLPGQQAAGFISDGARDHHGYVDVTLFADFGDGVEGGLGVQRVEDGFDQQQIGAAVQKAVDLFAIGFAQIVEGDGAVAGVGHVGRDRRRAVGRTERAGDEARPAVFGRDACGSVAAEPRAIAVEFIGQIRHVVIGLRDRGRGEGVGRDNVGAGAQVIGVDILDRLRLGQDQQIVVAPDVAVKVLETLAAERGLVIFQALDHGAHGAIEHQNAFAGRREQGGSFRRHGHGHRIRQLSVRHWGGCPANG